MIGFLSHEIRNPQTAISMSIDSVLTEARRKPRLFRDEHVRLFEIVRSSSEFVTTLLDGTQNINTKTATPSLEQKSTSPASYQAVGNPICWIFYGLMVLTLVMMSLTRLVFQMISHL